MNTEANVRLEVRDIDKAFGSLAALRDVSLAVQEGELVSLLGPSGCGKTTLLRIIAGLETPDAGRVFIDGKDVTSVTARQRRVGMVFQHYALFPHMTVTDNVAYGLRMRGMAAAEVSERVAETLSVVQLHGTEDRYPRQLSGGQQQRVALARALVTEPAILLLDEPLSALDLKLRQQMQLEFRRIQQQLGITTVYVTHDQAEALTLSDRIAVFNRGRLEQVGSGPEIYERPTSRFVAHFIGEATVLAGTVLGVTADRIQAGLPGDIVLEARFSGPMPEPGRSISLVVRPERVRWLPPNEPAPASTNEVTGQLREFVYLGNTFMGSANLPGGVALRFQIPAGGTTTPHVGDQVRLAFAPEALWPVGEGPS